MSSKSGPSLLIKLRNAKWQAWVSPVLLVLASWLLLRMVFSNEPFFLKTVSPTARGEPPEVHFEASDELVGAVVMFILFNVFMFQTLRQWARYYLNRKLILSYLLFAIVPLLTNLFIFTAGITTWLGISNTFAVERLIEQQVDELKRFTSSITQEDVLTADTELVRKKVNNKRFGQGSSYSFIKTTTIPIEVYWLTSNVPGEPSQLIPLYLSGAGGAAIEEGFGEGEEQDKLSILDMIYEDTPQFERVLPSWLMDRSEWTDIVNKDNKLSLRHFSFVNYGKQGKLMVVTAIPVDARFFGILKDYQTMRVTLTNLDGVELSTRETPAPWYQSVPLKLFSSSRDVLALDWESGLFTEYGRMTFEVEPSVIRNIIERDNELNIFYGEEQRTALRFIMTTTVLLCLGVLVAIVFGIYLISYITRSLNIIAEGHEQIKSGFFNFRLPHIGKDQLGSMGRSFNSMAGSIESLLSQVAEKEKYQEELRIARDIQMSLLPDIDALEWCTNIAAVCIPAREVGGDYYEVVPAGNGMIGIFIADVSGKGTSAAFYMAELKGVLIALRHLWQKPEELLMGMNDILKPALASNVFISAAYLLLDPHVREGTLVRAGHCPSFLVREDGEVDELMPPGMALGIAPNPVFGKIIKPITFSMGLRDKVVLYTDGLDEMTNQHEMYGIEKLKLVLRGSGELPVHALEQAILKDVLDFLGSEEQNDDLTLVVAGLPDLEPEKLQATAVSEATRDIRGRS